MLHDLLVEIKLDKFTCYRCLETSDIEAACSEIDAAQPLYYRCLVEVFKAWYKKTGPFPSPAATFSEFQLDSPCVGKTFKDWHKQVQQGTAAAAPADADKPADADAPADANADKPADADAPADAPAPATPPAP
jgi:hypothetical protein